jgi:hypothetical protein
LLEMRAEFEFLTLEGKPSEPTSKKVIKVVSLPNASAAFDHAARNRKQG